jgi:hypothetical protein
VTVQLWSSPNFIIATVKKGILSKDEVAFACDDLATFYTYAEAFERNRRIMDKWKVPYTTVD